MSGLLFGNSKGNAGNTFNMALCWSLSLDLHFFSSVVDSYLK